MVDLPSKTFCAFPFTHLVIHNGGTYGPCCSASEHFCLNDETNKVESLKMFDSIPSMIRLKPYGLGIEEAFNSEPMEHIRQEMLKGNRPSACESCWKAEKDELIMSKRQQNNMFYFALKPEFVDIFDYDPIEISTNLHVRSLDLKFSNKCNLHCLMCSTGSSDMWIPLDEKISQYLTKRNLKRDFSGFTGVAGPGEWDLSANDEMHDTNLYHGSEHTIHGREQFYEKVGSFPQERYEEIKSLIPQLREIQCTGGEPFVSKQFIELLTYAVETGHAEHIALEITTNGTKFVTDVMELLVHFKQIRFLVSIDGTGSTYDYIRAPFNYDLLLERLYMLKDYVKSGQLNATIDIPVVGMSYNLFDYYNLKKLGKSFSKFTNSHISMTLYNDDNPLHIKWLPDELIDTALNFYADHAVVQQQLKFYVDTNYVDPATKLHNQRRMKNYTLLMDKMLNRDYHDFLDSRIVEFLDSVKSDL